MTVLEVPQLLPEPDVSSITGRRLIRAFNRNSWSPVETGHAPKWTRFTYSRPWADGLTEVARVWLNKEGSWVHWGVWWTDAEDARSIRRLSDMILVIERPSRAPFPPVRWFQ